MTQLTATPETFWSSLRENLLEVIPADTFRVWFDNIRVGHMDEDGCELLTPNEFSAIWIRDNYLDVIRQEADKLVGYPYSVELLGSYEEDAEQSQNRIKQTSKPKSTRTSGPSLHGRSLGINPKNTFSNFIVGAGSELAHAACVAVSNAPAHAYNPLFLYGDTGLGKTHLMHAVAHQALNRNPSCRIAYVSCERFTNEFIRAIQENTLTKFRSRYRSVDYLLIDDIQFLAGKERIQEEFFHTFNELYEAQRQIFLTSDRPAGEIDKIESRLLSRFQWGLVADIQAPDWETRVAILTKKAQAMGISIEPEVLEFLAKNISRNVRRMEGALTRVAGYVGLTRKKADLETIQRLLRDILREENLSRITIETIQKKVVDYYHLRMADMLSRRRPANIAFPRQVAMYLSRILTEHSLQEIGGAFGGRDHGTVIHACKTVENMMDQDASIKTAVELLNEQLSQSMS
ncbi:MAG: chromosomal replication initiator protein DnaA [Verrucomicrobia bacterium]|jgi:chromosomal replication initiator protein|nr:chromosomal replication initiator protein DnaA [Verrucomicrobiota bacterium]MDA0905316.1 chromosomal replication initiator protein DnaA [Verrucomicrobiota bacterium]MDA1077982.1 chromosomal replication initiator protein DnaA [Verrucomicrobiota bacterium]